MFAIDRVVTVKATAGGSGNQSRSHSGASTTFLAPQDDISENSEGDYVRHSRDIRKDLEASSANQPPSPSVPTMSPVVPSPLFQTMVVPSHLGARTNQTVPEALAGVEEVL